MYCTVCNPKLSLGVRNGSTISFSAVNVTWGWSQFIIVLVSTQHILSYARPPSQALQKADCDNVKACIDANTYKKVILREQREDSTFRNLWGKIEALADSVDVVVIEKPRMARRMAHRSTAGDIDDMAMQYFKVNVFFPFIDHCLM